MTSSEEQHLKGKHFLDQISAALDNGFEEIDLNLIEHTNKKK